MSITRKYTGGDFLLGDLLQGRCNGLHTALAKGITIVVKIVGVVLEMCYTDLCCEYLGTFAI